MSAIVTTISEQVTAITAQVIALAGAIAPLVATAFLVTWAFKALRKFARA